jgi:hypothetical protein
MVVVAEARQMLPSIQKTTPTPPIQYKKRLAPNVVWGESAR